MNFKSIVPEKTPTAAKLFLFGTVLNGIGNGMFNVVVQLYFASLGYNASTIGSIFMMNMISGAVLTIPMGILADRYGRRRIIMLGALTTAFSVILFLTSSSIVQFMVSFLGIGITNAAAVVFSPLYSSFFDNGDLDKAFGLWGSLNVVTTSMGSLLGFIPPFLVKTFGFNLQVSYWIFMAVASVFFLGQFFFYLSARGAIEPARNKGFKLTLTSRDLTVKFSLIALITSVSYGVFIGLVPYYVNRKFGIQSDALGALLFASNLVSAGAQAIAPSVSKKLGAVRTMAMSIALATPFYLMIPLAPSFTYISALYIGRLGFVTLAQPLISSTFMKNLREEEKATANGIRMMSQQGGGAIGPWLGGQLMERASLDLPAYIGGGMYAILAVLTFLLLRNVEEIPETEPPQTIETTLNPVDTL